MSVAYANDLADPRDYVTVSSGLLLSYGVGAVIGPFAASSAIAAFGGQMLFMFAAATHAALFALAAARWVVFDREAHPEQVEFSDALTAVQTASQVYEEEVWPTDESSESEEV